MRVVGFEVQGLRFREAGDPNTGCSGRWDLDSNVVRSMRYSNGLYYRGLKDTYVVPGFKV